MAVGGKSGDKSVRAHTLLRHPAHESIVTDEDLLAFVTASVDSVWTLELLLLLKRQPERAWETEELIREMRSSPVVIADALKMLQGTGLVMQNAAGAFRYQAASERLDRLATELEQAYSTKPMTVIKAIVAAPPDKLRIFSDAFKFKD
jgi:hypothetical protein